MLLLLTRDDAFELEREIEVAQDWRSEHPLVVADRMEQGQCFQERMYIHGLQTCCSRDVRYDIGDRGAIQCLVLLQCGGDLLEQWQGDVGILVGETMCAGCFDGCGLDPVR